MSKRNEYLKKLLVFGAGFMPTSTDVGNIFNAGLIPQESMHTETMVPFKIDKGSDESLIRQADLLLTSDGMGCSLNSNEYDHKIVELNSKKFIIAWVLPHGSPKYRKQINVESNTTNGKKWWQIWK